MDTTEIAARYSTLADLAEAFRAGDLDDEDCSTLPTYGGSDLAQEIDTHGIWSWDETRVLVGLCGDDSQIVPRADVLPTYTVETRGDGCSIWSVPEIESGAATFRTEAEAHAAIDALRALGGEWLESEYRVRKIPARVRF